MVDVVVAGAEVMLGESADIAAVEPCRDELTVGCRSAYLPPHKGSQVASNSSRIVITAALGRSLLDPIAYRRIRQQGVCGCTAEPR